MYTTVDVSTKTIANSREISEINAEKLQSVLKAHHVYTDGTESDITTTTRLLVVNAKPEIKTTIQISSHDRWMLIFLVFIQVIFVTMVYGPIAAFLVEMFPTKIRYTSMSLPYHVGNGIFGGLLPAISTYFVTNAQANGDPEYYLEGLWYPIVIASICFVIGMIYLKSKNQTNHD
jgi:MFS family permease